MVKWIVAGLVVVIGTILFVKYAKANPTANKLTGVVTGQYTVLGKLSTRAIEEIKAHPSTRSGVGHF